MEELQAFIEGHKGLTLGEIRELVKKNADFRRRVADLYKRVYHRELNTRCSDCWVDAFVILRRTNFKTLREMANRQFELKAGALLIDVVNHDDKKAATRHNLTDELAKYHLRTNPNYIARFARYPEDWRVVVGLDKKGRAGKPTRATNKPEGLSDGPEAPAEKPAGLFEAPEATEGAVE